METEISGDLLATATAAARSAGSLLIENLGQLSDDDIREKQSFDFVTKVDTLSEGLIMKTIREKFPDHRFLSEESLRQGGGDAYRWIIDPLDGTTNYIHGYPMFSVSIALEYRGKIILGVIYDPLKCELFHAVKGSGAFLNGRRMQVSRSEHPASSLIATGFPFRAKERIDIYLEAFKDIFLEVSDLRRAGSAALDLAYIAAGRLEGFFELHLSPWDIAAGSLLIREAGGVVSDFGGGEAYLFTGNIVAGNPAIHSMLLRTVKKTFAGVIDR